MTVRCALSTGPGRLVLQDAADLAPGPADVVVRTKVAGVCGSDLAVQRGPFRGRLSLPRVLGHEWSGVVVTTGAEVTGLVPGDRVVAEEILWCGSCRECRSGYYDHCQDPGEIGFTIDGAFATSLRVPAKACHVLPEGCSFEVGALVEPLAVAYNAVHLPTSPAGGIRAGQKALVIGQGPIGLFAAMWLRTAGVQVLAAERDPFRRALATSMGIEVVADVEATTDPFADGIDICIEASGDHQAVNAVLGALRPHGQVVIVGHSSGSGTRLDLEQFVLKGLHLSGSCGQVGRNTYAAVLAALRTGVVDPTGVITHRVSLAELPDTVEAACVGSMSFGKIIVTSF